MKCFYCFKYRNRSKSRRAAPLFNNLNLSEVSETESGTKSSRSAPSPCSIPELYQERAHNLRVFKFSELRQATNNFNRLLKIGEGGFGCVYRGTIRASEKGDTCDRIVVAIKKLKPDGYEGHKQWVAEVQFLGVVEHPNLVKLIGYCAVNGERGIQRLLVYEYMTNKSLDDHLFNKAYRTVCWECRLQIVLGAARGLAYLHEELETQVIYRDFKSSNVLLDDTFTPKLSDFGLAREGPAAGHTHVSTAVVGTYGYAAPDYIQTGHLSSKSDVWSFGVVLYEILTGRRPFERNRPKPEQRLLEWVKQHCSRKFDMIMDPRLENNYSVSQARMIMKLADSCLVKSPKERPKMSEVVDELERIVQYSGMFILEDDDKPVSEASPETNQADQALESAKRRMSHLAKIGEQVFGGSKRKFMIMRMKEAERPVVDKSISCGCTEKEERLEILECG